MRLIPQIANWNAYLIMVTSPTYQPRHLLSAWGVSFCIHAIVLASATTAIAAAMGNGTLLVQIR